MPKLFKKPIVGVQKLRLLCNSNNNNNNKRCRTLCRVPTSNNFPPLLLLLPWLWRTSCRSSRNHNSQPCWYPIYLLEKACPHPHAKPPSVRLVCPIWRPMQQELKPKKKNGKRDWRGTVPRHVLDVFAKRIWCVLSLMCQDSCTAVCLSFSA